MPNVFRYALAFKVWHPSADLGPITLSLGWVPDAHWTVGEPRTTPTGRALGGVRDESYRSYRIGDGDNGCLAALIDHTLSDLERCSEALVLLKASGGRLEFHAYWYPNGDTGQVFSADLMGRLARLGVDLGINVYEDALVTA